MVRAVEFSLTWSPIFEPDYHEPERIMPNQHAGVDRDRRERIEVFWEAHFAERQPRRRSGNRLEARSFGAVLVRPRSRNGR